MTIRRLLASTSASILVALFAATGCGGKLNGVVDYDRERDFQDIRRIVFFEDIRPSERPPTQARKRIRAELERQLPERGFTLVGADDAQAQLLYHVGRRSNVRGGSMVGARGERASLAIEFRDPATGRAMWYGTVEQSWQEGLDVEERVESAISLLLDQFPPEPTSGGERRAEKRVSE